MNKRTIKWEKFRNPLLAVGDEEEEGSRVMVRSTPFGPEGYKFNPDFPSEQVYIGHTNFDIDDDVIDIIDNTEGVEIFHYYSPYRMRITIGKAFNPKKIRRILKERLCNVNEPIRFNQEINTEIYKETVRLNEEDKPWFMYILPNGQFESKSFTTQEELEKNIIQYEILRESIGGTIIYD